ITHGLYPLAIYFCLSSRGIMITNNGRVPPYNSVYSGPAIVAQGLRKLYGTHEAVKNVNLLVQPGEIVGFLGPNGAGKTTTLKLLTGLLKPTAGTALIMGHDIQTDSRAAKATFGYVPDTPNLYGKLNG